MSTRHEWALGANDNVNRPEPSAAPRACPTCDLGVDGRTTHRFACTRDRVALPVERADDVAERAWRAALATGRGAR